MAVLCEGGVGSVVACGLAVTNLLLPLGAAPRPICVHVTHLSSQPRPHMHPAGDQLKLFQSVIPVFRFDIPTSLFLMPYLVGGVLWMARWLDWLDGLASAEGPSASLLAGKILVEHCSSSRTTESKGIPPAPFAHFQ